MRFIVIWLCFCITSTALANSNDNNNVEIISSPGVIIPWEYYSDNDSVDIEHCTTSINGEKNTIGYDLNSHWSGPNPWLYEHYSYREIYFSGWGEIDCPSAITMAKIAPEFAPMKRSNFCLYWDEEKKTYTGFDEGPSDAYGICKEVRTVCQRVGGVKDVLVDFADSATGTIGSLLAGSAGAVAGASAVAGAAGVVAVEHSSGALILTGSAGYVAGSIGSIGAKALGVIATGSSLITAPATLAVGGVVVAGIGGATYLCWDNM